jgi:hypothetical protein
MTCQQQQQQQQQQQPQWQAWLSRKKSRSHHLGKAGESERGREASFARYGVARDIL